MSFKPLLACLRYSSSVRKESLLIRLGLRVSVCLTFWSRNSWDISMLGLFKFLPLLSSSEAVTLISSSLISLFLTGLLFLSALILNALSFGYWSPPLMLSLCISSSSSSFISNGLSVTNLWFALLSLCGKGGGICGMAISCEIYSDVDYFSRLFKGSLILLEGRSFSAELVTESD